MSEHRPVDSVRATIERTEDGYIRMMVSVESLDGLIRDHVYRVYDVGRSLDDVADDCGRLLFGWAAWGHMGFEEARRQIRPGELV